MFLHVNIYNMCCKPDCLTVLAGEGWHGCTLHFTLWQFIQFILTRSKWPGYWIPNLIYSGLSAIWLILWLVLWCPFLLQHNSRELDQSQWGRATETVSRETAGNWPHAAGAWGKDSAPAGGWSAAVILTLGDTRWKCPIFPNLNCFGACFFQEAQLARSEAERMASLAGSQSHASLLSLDAAMEEIPEDERPPNILSPSNNKDR